MAEAKYPVERAVGGDRSVRGSNVRRVWEDNAPTEAERSAEAILAS